MPDLKSFTTLHLNSFSSNRDIFRKDNNYDGLLNNFSRPDSDYKKINLLIESHLVNEENAAAFTWHLN